ncbi:MAG: hypothetical protein ACTHN3_05860 [Solirubrobacterales bacterium]
MRRSEKAKLAALFVLENLDAFLVMVVATVVVVLHIVDPDHSEHMVSSATLALLGITAFVLLRDRNSRTDLGALRQIATDALNDMPYSIISQDNEWDLKSRELATVTMETHVRFTRNQMSTMSHWNTGPGTVLRCDARWRRSKNDRWIEAELIDELPVRGGKKRTFSLGQEHSRGDTLEWCVEMDVKGRFSDSHQSVTHEARLESDYPRSVRIVWPPTEVPSNVEMVLGERPARPLALKTVEDRTVIEEKVGRLRKDEIFKISWIW